MCASKRSRCLKLRAAHRAGTIARSKQAVSAPHAVGYARMLAEGQPRGKSTAALVARKGASDTASGGSAGTVAHGITNTNHGHVLRPTRPVASDVAPPYVGCPDVERVGKRGAARHQAPDELEITDDQVNPRERTPTVPGGQQCKQGRRPAGCKTA